MSRILFQKQGHLRRVTIQYVGGYMRDSCVNICVIVYIKKNSGRAHIAGKLTPMAYNDPDPYKVSYYKSTKI